MFVCVRVRVRVCRCGCVKPSVILIYRSAIVRDVQVNYELNVETQMGMVVFLMVAFGTRLLFIDSL